MANFNISITRPRYFLHSDAFRDVADSLAWSLVALGHTANVRENWISTDEADTNILFGAELLAPGQALPRNTILYNLEQPTHEMMPKVQSLARGLRVWDYSSVNVRKWKELGFNVKHVPIGYTPNLTRIPTNVEKDIDCLFLGWLTPRRKKILDDLTEAGLKVVYSDRCYGGARDCLIARSNIVLNIHHDGRDMFEIVRVSYLLANRACVVSEISSDDSEYKDLQKYAIRVPYDEIVDHCKALCADGYDFRSNYADEAFDNFAKRDYVSTIREALTISSPVDIVQARYDEACSQEGDMKPFLSWMKDHAKGVVLEIGTRAGHSTAALLAGVQQNGGVVLSLDLTDCSSLYRNHPQWKFIQTSSRNPKLKVPPLDFVLIDGDHTREGYKADLERFWPLVKPGGLILSHDITPEPGMSYEDNPQEVLSYCVTSEGGFMEFHDNFPSKGIGEEFQKFCDDHKHELRWEVLPGKFGMGVIKKGPVLESDESWEASKALTSLQA